MKRLLITLMVVFSVLLTSCGESNNTDSSSDTQTSNSSASALPASSAMSTAFDGTEKMAQELVEEWITSNPLKDGKLTNVVLEEIEPVIARNYYAIAISYDEYRMYERVLVDKKTGEMFVYDLDGNMTPIEEYYQKRQEELAILASNDVSPEKAKLLLEGYFTGEIGMPNPPLMEYDDVYEIDGKSFYAFWLIFNGEDRESDILIVDSQSGALFAMRIKDNAYMPLDDWYRTWIFGESPWLIPVEGENQPGSSQQLVATDLLGQWVWDAKYGSNYVKYEGENTLYHLTLLSNGTCSGGVAIKFDPGLGVFNSDIIGVSNWEFLEYEQILQLTGTLHDSVWTGSSWKGTSKNVTASFNVRMVDGVLYLENINDSSTAIIQYNKS